MAIYGSKTWTSLPFLAGSKPSGGTLVGANAAATYTPAKAGAYSNVQPVSGATTRNLTTAKSTLPSPSQTTMGFGADTGALSGGADGGGGGIDQLAAARNEIAASIERANKIYELLGGDVKQLVQGQRGDLEESYQKELDSLIRAQADDALALDAAYGARGLTDSSYRINAQDRNSRAYSDERGSLADEVQGQRAGLGRYLETNLAKFDAGRDYISSATKNLDQVNDLESLMTLQNDLNARIASLREERSGLRTEGEFTKALDKYAPTTGRAQALRGRINTIANSPAPPAEKRRIMLGFVSSSGLPDEEKQELVEFYDSLGA